MGTPNRYEEIISELHRVEDDWPIELAFVNGKNGLYLVNQDTGDIVDCFAINYLKGYRANYYAESTYECGNGVTGGG
jgi:hypothetical protein